LENVPRLPFEPEGLRGRRLEGAGRPSRVVIVRLQAFGDAAAALPLIAALEDRFPECRLDVVTGPAAAALFEARTDVDRVYRLDQRSSLAAKLLDGAPLAAALSRPRADAILDLQRSRLTRVLTRLARPRGWVAFDRFAPESALARYRAAAEWVGLGPLEPVFAARIAAGAREPARALLDAAGRDPARPLVCLNPAGGWITKQWPLGRFAELGRALVREHGVELVLLGSGAILPRLKELATMLDGAVLDLTGRTAPDTAMAVLASCALVVSEDSGLMHLASAQGVPTIALFGASRSAWSRPTGPRSTGFYSEDLPCGACLQPVCARGDLLCLDRVSVEAVRERARAALAP
jgi:ADP-heptose:LPS heptosyltransferase